MKVSRGDVVLVDFPFASGVASKLRPAIVVQNDVNNRRLATTIFAPITSTLRQFSSNFVIEIGPRRLQGSSP
jgi:mRNA interferase MazF